MIFLATQFSWPKPAPRLAIHRASMTFPTPAVPDQSCNEANDTQSCTAKPSGPDGSINKVHCFNYPGIEYGDNPT